ncbi:hypothetical protein [Sphingomonas alba]|uniref:Lipoprotein n=1 Tax=Sphingomonas alba TaxID=2908208 RepID=A0ABT0RKQ7_9SPHN|nr:hypothetical protein [Sphingomonas alba]MCL6683228.1 hypothetical protein [Sphingomonas alba]
MKRSAAIAILLAACSQQNQQPTNNTGQPVEQADANGVAPAAIANESTPPPVSAQPDEATNASVPPPPHVDPNAPPPADEKSALGAARRLQEYCDAVATKRYRDAYSYWGDGGKRSGLTFEQFRASFAKYGAYDCHIGKPGDSEGAAGSIYITVPLQVTGALTKGGGFVLEGPITMRRVNDVDGSSAEQRRWHIESSGLKPRP